jgi:hypothetical protein
LNLKDTEDISDMTKQYSKLILVLMCTSMLAGLQAQNFNEWFEEGAMRIDLVFTGTANRTSYALESLKRESYYSGPLTSLVEPFDYGDHRFTVKDAASGTLLYTHSYCTLFREWQTTTEADTVTRAFNHVLRFPWPRKPVEVEIFDRDRKGKFRRSWSGQFDPGSFYADPTPSKPFETVDLEVKGPSDTHVDLLFLAEGYRAVEMDKFLADARRSMEYIFSEEPFLSHRDAFNVRAVLSSSVDSGTDIPGKGIWKNTVMNSSFYTFGIERYMTTPDMKSVCDVAANAPYDQVYILVNTDKYGGGGVYNFYSISAADNDQSRAVVIHEFGHAFAGLADEYYSSKVAYNDYFPLDVEPWNPNLTTLVDFGSKWQEMLDKRTPVPTPEKKKNENVVGVYEGGGYVSKGVYRPMIDCRMHSNDAAFCPVCSKAILDMIRRHAGR